MPPLVYWIDADGITLDRIRAIGLGYAFDRGPDRRSGPGPGNAPGTQFVESGTGAIYNPPRWEPHPTIQGVAFGWDPEDPPGPADLARAERPQAAHPVRLCDGQEWDVPVARYFPRSIKWVNGKPEVSEEPYRPDHRQLWAMASKYFQAALGAGDEGASLSMSLADAIDAAALALSMGYRVSTAEISALGLLSTEHVAPICQALCDFPSLKDLEASARPN